MLGIKSDKVKLDSYQVSLFLKKYKNNSASTLLTTLQSNLNSFYDGAIEQFIPQDNLPADLPRLILNSSDGRKKFIFSYDKISMKWTKRKREDKDLIIDMGEINRILVELVSSLGEDAVFDRVGFITSYYYDISDPVSILEKSLVPTKLFPEKANDYEFRDIQLKLTFKTELVSDRANHVITYVNGIDKEDKSIKLIGFFSDINTHQDLREDGKYNLDEIKAILEVANKKSIPEYLFSS